MLASDAEIEAMLRSEEHALSRWFDNFMVVSRDGLILAGGLRPSYERIGQIFDQWVQHRHADLRLVICDGLGYKNTTKTQRELGQIAVIAAVSAALASAPTPFPVDPLATAVLLVARQALDTLCPDQPTLGGDG